MPLNNGVHACLCVPPIPFFWNADLAYYRTVKQKIDSLTDVSWEFKRTVDYHEEMNSDVRLWPGWKQLIPALDRPSVTVLDNASYHNRIVPSSVAPTSAATKAKMAEWLRAQKVTIDAQTPAVRTCQATLTFTCIWIGCSGRNAGPCCTTLTCELKAIELIWADVKGWIGHDNITFKVKDVEQLVMASFCRITTERWKACVQQTIKVGDAILERRQRDWRTSTHRTYSYKPSGQFHQLWRNRL